MEPVTTTTTAVASGTGFFGTLLSSLWGFVVWVAVIFLFVMWFWLLITIVSDLFRRKDVGGFAKVLWIIFLVVLPLLGVLVYVLTQSGGMSERHAANVVRARDDLREFVGVSTADELTKLAALKANGTISEEEYARLRARAIG